MGAVNIYPYRMHGSMLVRRVIRIGAKFVCGICRTHHKEVSKANSCLHACWNDVKSRAPFMQVRRFNRIMFACIYCQRSYQTLNHACECAADCTEEMGITEYNGNASNSNRSRLDWIKQNQLVPIPITRKPVAAPIVETPPPVVAVPPSMVESAPAVPERPAAALQSAEVATSSADPTEGKKLRKNGRTKKFDRAGAKYVCEVCLEKYFTKSEVEKCFDEHPD